MENLLEQTRNMSDEDQKVFFQKFCESLTIRQTLNIVKHLENEWGVEATPSFNGGGIAPPIVEEEVEQTEFDVVVTDVGSNRISVVKTTRQAADMQLKEASELLKTLPATVLTKVTKDKADEVRKLLEASGATVEIK